MSNRYEYVILSMSPNDDVEAMAGRLNEYGKLGFKTLAPVVQTDHVIYTLELDSEADRVR